MPVRPGTRVVVVGTAGGVGTTTVATLLEWALGTFRAERAGVAGRGGDGDSPRAAELTVHDLGPSAAAILTDVGVGVGVGTRPGVGIGVGVGTGPGVGVGTRPRSEGRFGTGVGSDVLVVVCGAHAHGLLAARDALGGSPAVVVPVAVAGRAEPGSRLVARAAAFEWDAVVVPIGRSRALAAGGALPAPGLAPGPFRAGIAVAVEVVRLAQRPPMPPGRSR